jgi:hypothetical protein
MPCPAWYWPRCCATPGAMCCSPGRGTHRDHAGIAGTPRHRNLAHPVRRGAGRPPDPALVRASLDRLFRTAGPTVPTMKPAPPCAAMSKPTACRPLRERCHEPLTLEQLMDGVQDLPSLPAVVMELLSSIDQEDVDISVLARKVSYDQALTAKTLHLANSSVFGLQVKVTTIQQAITFLGFQATRNLITAAALTGSFPSGRVPGLRRQGVLAPFDRHRRLRPRAGAAPALQPGLRLHGRVAARHRPPGAGDRPAGALPRGAGLARQHGCEWREAERAVLGSTMWMPGWPWPTTGIFRTRCARRSPVTMRRTRRAPAPWPASCTWRTRSSMRSTWRARKTTGAARPDVAWNAMGLSEEAWLHLFRETERSSARCRPS